MRVFKMRLRPQVLLFISFCLLSSFLSIAKSEQSSDASTGFAPIPSHHLHNAHTVTFKVLSGAQPDGEAGFKELSELGVKTIISVDGAKPDIETARKYGIRYVHLPIGYDGVSDSQGQAIAKAINEMPGKVYVHCHHGKHRSAAAVAVACVYNGSLAPSQAESVLKTFGTGANYTGLWKSARDARPIDPASLRTLKVEFVEAAEIGDFAERMVYVDRHWDHLKIIQKARWAVPADHPDLDPAHEALQVLEHLREAGRLDEIANHPEPFRALLKEGESLIETLHDNLAGNPIHIEQAEEIFAKVNANCTACHRSYRD